MGSPKKRLQYQYDSRGNRSLLIDPDGGRFTYSYDSVGRMTRVVAATPLDQHKPASVKRRAEQAGIGICTTWRVRSGCLGASCERALERASPCRLAWELA
ncbi:MAG: RHS repeat protein [Planctomyces sp.]|nr:RHS repeat protein [Planctomyces sp.]